VDLASLPPTLFESELFGHTRGAFTDAREERTGRFESASGGSLFLDEIGNLPISLQSKILTALENREITPVGSTQTIPIDIRLISASNRDLYRMVDEQLFRQDLLYRLNTVQIELPPLRERGDDILLLTEYFIRRFAGKYDKPGLKIGQRALDYLKAHSWPGNIRELQHAVENAVIMCDSKVLSPSDLNLRISKPAEDGSLNLESIEKSTIEKALLKHHGKFSSACAELGISRTTLYHKIKKYGL
jgi:transcriptional regulator with PAS, ATPase and Fis domain